ncbi:MAG: hypothetical protein M1826_007160 [Phylliscum demangeonii]|nr:MAG: hypothetical protein M1826_007160 [Phylliscum demangeonii]
MVLPTAARLQSHGLRPWIERPHLKTTYQSPFGPKYKIPFNIHGWSLKTITRAALHLSGFGAAGLLAVLYLAEGIPRVRRDIFQKIPVLGEYWVREIPPSDNPF